MKNNYKIIKQDSGVHKIYTVNNKAILCDTVVSLCSLLLSNSGGFMPETIEYANSIP